MYKQILISLKLQIRKERLRNRADWGSPLRRRRTACECRATEEGEGEGEGERKEKEKEKEELFKIETK